MWPTLRRGRMTTRPTNAQGMWSFLGDRATCYARRIPVAIRSWLGALSYWLVHGCLLVARWNHIKGCGSILRWVLAISVSRRRGKVSLRFIDWRAITGIIARVRPAWGCITVRSLRGTIRGWGRWLRH